MYDSAVDNKASSISANEVKSSEFREISEFSELSELSE